MEQNDVHLTREHLVEMQKGNFAIYWVVKGPKGAVSFHLLIYWGPEFWQVTPVDFCTHRHLPKDSNHKPYGLCEFLNWGICYGEVDSQGADEFWSRMVDFPETEADNDTVWEELERRYNEM